MSNSSTYGAGLDIGGTTIKAFLVDADGSQAGDLVEVRSHVDQGYRKTFEQLCLALDKLCAGAGISRDAIGAVGMDVPAPSCDGVIWGKANLAQDWVGVNIRDEFSAEIDRPVFMTNDGNAAALGEYAMRDRIGLPMLFIAPGTGLGGGLVLANGDIYEGANGLAMEVGHITVPFHEDNMELPDCTCGRTGCVEAWVSLMALRRQVEIHLAKPEYADHPLNKQDSPIAEKAFQLRDYAEKDDTLALAIFGRQARILGYAMGDQVSEVDPGLIVVGGGLAETEGKFRDWYLDQVREGFAERAAPFYQHSPLPPHEPTTTFEWAIGGDGSAAFGVARKALDLTETRDSALAS
jgi:predicted NBD/HSP70 family sugar kinase